MGGAILLLGICLPLFFQLKSLELTHTTKAIAALAGEKGPPVVWLGKKLSLTIAAAGFLAGLAIMISGLRAESRAAKRARKSQNPEP